MPLGEARRNHLDVRAPRGATPIVCFDWGGCAAHLETADRAIIAALERFLMLRARSESLLPPNSDGSAIAIMGRDRGSLVRTSAWQAWASERDQLLYLVLEALGQIFVEGYAGIVFHAGAIDLGQGALAIHGPSLSGKSTLADCARRRGFDVIGDDRVTLGPDHDTVQPFPRCLKLRCQTDQEASELAEGVPAHLVAKAIVGNERRVILARSLPGFVGYDEPRPIRALIQLERVQSGVRLERIEPSAVLEVALRNIVSSDFNPTAVVRLIKSQSDQHRLYRLAIGERQTEAALDLLRAL